MKKLDQRSSAMDSKTMTAIVRDLFPVLSEIDWEANSNLKLSIERFIIIEDTLSSFTTDELVRAIRKLSLGKASGSDFISNELLKLAATRHPIIFLKTYNTCQARGHFLNVWKKAKLVLLRKGLDMPLNQPSSYRPISLLDGAGNVLERLLLNRLEGHIDEVAAQSNNQFEFRRTRSTVDVVNAVLRLACSSNSRPVQNVDLCAVVSLDVRNAFNWVPWNLIDAALQKSSVPIYLIRILKSYMSNRCIDSRGRGQDLAVTVGILQRAVREPTLWNIFYDSLLMQIPRNDKLIVFADNMAVAAMAYNGILIEELINPVFESIS